MSEGGEGRLESRMKKSERNMERKERKKRKK